MAKARASWRSSDFVDLPPAEWCMDFMYDLRALALVVTGALPFAVGTQMTPDAPLLGAMIYYAGLAGAGTVSAMVIPFRSRFQPLAAFVIFSVAFASLVLAGTFTEPGSTARSLATSGGLAGGYIVGLALATTCFGVERPLLRTAAATGCIVIPWGTAFLLIRFMAQWTAALDGRLAGLPYFLAAKVLVEANVAVVGAMQRVAELDQHQTAALVVATAASGQMISFSGFLRSYLNVEDKWDVLTISGSGSCVLEIFGRLLPFISSKRKKLSVIKLVIMSMTPCLKRVILLTTGLYWALSEVSNTAIRGKLRIPPMAVLASWLSGLVADTVLLVVQNYKQGQDESLWKTATRLCFTGQFVPIRHASPPPGVALPERNPWRVADIAIAAMVGGTSAYWLSTTANYMVLAQDEDLSGSHSFWLLTIPAVVWPSLLAMVVSLKVQAKVASVEETSETTEDVQAAGLPEKPGCCSDGEVLS